MYNFVLVIVPQQQVPIWKCLRFRKPARKQWREREKCTALPLSNREAHTWQIPWEMTIGEKVSPS